jgi:hypothetical protein
MGSSKSWDKIQTDDGFISADTAENLLNIIGAGGIEVSAVHGLPSVITIDGSSIVGGGDSIKDEFVAEDDQTSFTLSQAPSDDDSLSFSVNGVEYDDDVDYTLVSGVITWTDALFSLEAGDLVVIRYI